MVPSSASRETRILAMQYIASKFPLPYAVTALAVFHKVKIRPRGHSLDTGPSTILLSLPVSRTKFAMIAIFRAFLVAVRTFPEFSTFLQYGTI